MWLGSARPSRAGDGALAIANFHHSTIWFAEYKVRFGGAPKPACEAPALSGETSVDLPEISCVIRGVVASSQRNEHVSAFK
jgi:hypothetical protein